MITGRAKIGTAKQALTGIDIPDRHAGFPVKRKHIPIKLKLAFRALEPAQQLPGTNIIKGHRGDEIVVIVSIAPDTERPVICPECGAAPIVCTVAELLP